MITKSITFDAQGVFHLRCSAPDGISLRISAEKGTATAILDEDGYQACDIDVLIAWCKLLPRDRSECPWRAIILRYDYDRHAFVFIRNREAGDEDEMWFKCDRGGRGRTLTHQDILEIGRFLRGEGTGSWLLPNESAPDAPAKATYVDEIANAAKAAKAKREHAHA